MSNSTPFFKSNAFKCFAIVISVLLICGVLLAVLSNVLKVSSEEQAQRAMEKIYGSNSGFKAESIDVDKTYSNELGNVKNVISVSNGDYLLQTTGKHGFSNGTVTVWIAFITEPSLSVRKVVYADNTNQSLISKIAGIYDTYQDKAVFDGVIADNEYKGNIQTGATYSSQATNNAVRVATDYVNKVLLKGAI